MLTLLMPQYTNIWADRYRFAKRVGAVFLGLAVAACATTSPAQRAADETLQAAQDAFASGDYARTIKLLRNSDTVDAADRRTQVDAHKLIAFSYCVTGRVALCRVEFEKALRLDPKFELSNAEKGHPIWGPAFEAARQRVGS